MFRSLKFQIAMAFFVVFVAISAVFSFYQFKQIESILTSSFENGLQLEGNSLLERASSNPFVIIPSTQEQQIQIWIEEIEGWSKLHQTDDFPEELENAWLDVENTFPNDQSLIINYETISLFIAHKFIVEDNISARTILLAKSNTGLQDEIEKVRRSLFGNNLIAASISFVIAMILSSLLLRPIQRMVNKMSTIKASADMNRLAFRSGSTEVGLLKSSFNEMIDRIESAIIKQNKFFDSASHELKTPLANMLVEIDYHLEVSKHEADLYVLKSLKGEVNRLSNLVNDFLLMSQLKNNELKLHLRSISLQELVFDVLEKMSISIKLNDFQIEFKIDENLSDIILADSNKLESIFYNTLSNCLKYGDNVENIMIHLSQKDNRLVLTITNRIDRDKAALHGQQLGLWISTEIAKKHGFHLSTKEDKDHFEVQLEIPINAHNSPH